MLLEFSITNFLSFKEKATFSMLANAGEEKSDNCILACDRKVLKTAAIYGANASGKSNLFKALNEVLSMLKGSNYANIDTKLPVSPFQLDDDSIKSPSSFEIKFIIDNIRYVYGFTLNQNQIYEEYLYYYPNNRETRIFDRTNINDYSFSQKEEKFLKEIVTKNAPNKFFLATATTWNYAKTKPVFEFLTSGINICFDAINLKNDSFMAYKNGGENLKKFALEFLEQTDFNIEDFIVSQVELPGELFSSVPKFIKKDISKPTFFQVLFKHKGNNKYLNLEEESMGTQMIFAFIPFINEALNNKKVLIVDELDKSLHPFLVQYIIGMFNNPETNLCSAQLIFNTHDTNLLNLNLLRRDQIWFTEKNSENGESELFSLTDFAVRKTENVEKGYILGRYGAVPFIKNDIIL